MDSSELQLSEVIAKTETCPHAMGIAKIGESFAIRCKRDDAAAIRSTLLPESAFAETASFPHDQVMYAAKNAQAVDFKLNAAHAKIEQLSQALHDVQNKAEQSHVALAADLGQVKEEQSFAQKKLSEVEASVAGCSQQIISQMQSMFQQMQSSMEVTVQALVNDPDKRQRTEQKNDPFAKA